MNPEAGREITPERRAWLARIRAENLRRRDDREGEPAVVLPIEAAVRRYRHRLAAGTIATFRPPTERGPA